MVLGQVLYASSGNLLPKFRIENCTNSSPGLVSKLNVDAIIIQCRYKSYVLMYTHSHMHTITHKHRDIHTHGHTHPLKNAHKHIDSHTNKCSIFRIFEESNYLPLTTGIWRKLFSLAFLSLLISRRIEMWIYSISPPSLSFIGSLTTNNRDLFSNRNHLKHKHTHTHTNTHTHTHIDKHAQKTILSPYIGYKVEYA